MKKGSLRQGKTGTVLLRLRKKLTGHIPLSFRINRKSVSLLPCKEVAKEIAEEGGMRYLSCSLFSFFSAPKIFIDAGTRNWFESRLPAKIPP
jgi:hypothetical protein